MSEIDNYIEGLQTYILLNRKPYVTELVDNLRALKNEFLEFLDEVFKLSFWGVIDEGFDVIHTFGKMLIVLLGLTRFRMAWFCLYCLAPPTALKHAQCFKDHNCIRNLHHCRAKTHKCNFSQ